MSSTATKTSEIYPTTLHEWPEFYKSLRIFGDSICTKFEDKNYDPYIFNRSFEIFSHDDVVFQMLTICNEIFTKRILSDDLNPYFHACPNSMQVKGDIYFKDKFLIKIKTPKTLPLKSTLIEDYKANLSHSTKAIEQIYSYMRMSGLSYAMLSTYINTWVIFKSDGNLFISPAIQRNKLILAIFYTLTLRDQSIHEETIKSHMEKIKEINEKLKLNLNLDVDCPAIETKLTENEPDPNDYFISEDFKQEFSSLETTISSIYDSIISCKPIGYGASGVVVRVIILNKTYAIKMIDLYKQSHLLPDLENELDMLKHLNSKHVMCVPKLYFGGKVFHQYCLVMSFLEGHTKNFENMNENEKNSCIGCLNELHRNFCLHGDIRYPNFITNNEMVFVIDFGRSKLLDDSDESRMCMQKEKNELLNLF